MYGWANVINIYKLNQDFDPFIKRNKKMPNLNPAGKLKRANTNP